jgi:hypothetical protein
VVADLSDHVDAPSEEASQARPIVEAPARHERSSSVALCLAGRTPIDQAACAILAQLVEREHVSARVLGPESLSINGVARLDAKNVEALCIVYLGRQSLAVVRYSVRRLRKRFPGVPIGVCLWGSDDLGPTIEAAQADATINSLKEAVAFCTKAEVARRAREPAPDPVLVTAVELGSGVEKLASA